MSLIIQKLLQINIKIQITHAHKKWQGMHRQFTEEIQDVQPH